MTPTMKAPGDAMPAGRVKFIHAIGAVAKVKFLSYGNHPYSGIFKGADQGLIRFSSAATPTKTQPMVPGFGLKFLRDGKDSANLVAMYSVDG
jgi:hypothetical protein